MNKETERLEKCLQAIKNCLKIPRVENCICFADAFKVLNLEVNELYKGSDKLSAPESRQKLISLKKEIGEIAKIISKENKECLGCSPCIASVVFKAYPNILNNLYTDNKL